jgi:hypothetical protein
MAAAVRRYRALRRQRRLEKPIDELDWYRRTGDRGHD